MNGAEMADAQQELKAGDAIELAGIIAKFDYENFTAHLSLLRQSNLFSTIAILAVFPTSYAISPSLVQVASC